MRNVIVSCCLDPLADLVPEELDPDTAELDDERVKYRRARKRPNALVRDMFRKTTSQLPGILHVSIRSTHRTCPC